MKKTVFFVGIILIVLSCNSIEQPQGKITDYHEFQSFSDFKETLSNIIAITDPAERETSLSVFWDSLKANNQIPFVLKDSVAFLYKGAYTSVAWAGDFSGWSPINGSQIEDSDVWMLEKPFLWMHDWIIKLYLAINGCWIQPIHRYSTVDLVLIQNCECQRGNTQKRLFWLME